MRKGKKLLQKYNIKFNPKKYTMGKCSYCNGKLKDYTNHKKGIFKTYCTECNKRFIMIYCRECKTLFNIRYTELNEIVCPNCSIVLYEYPLDYRVFNFKPIQYQLV